jgi:predicted RNA binding protein YcfA (HicA-like mRNA interferase family)
MNIMKVTARTIKKAIKELGFNEANFEISGNEINTALENHRLGNIQVKKVVRHLTKQGATYYGFLMGYGAWLYRFNESRTYTHELVSMNMD